MLPEIYSLTADLILDKCRRLTNTFKGEDYFLIFSNAYNVLGVEYNKPCFNNGKFELITEEDFLCNVFKELIAKLDNNKKEVNKLDLCVYDLSGIKILPYLVSENEVSIKNSGNRGFAGKLRDNHEIRDNNTIILIFDLDPIGTLNTASNKEIINSVLQNDYLKRYFKRVATVDWFNKLVDSLISSKGHVINKLDRISLLARLVGEQDKNINEVIEKYKMPLFYIDNAAEIQASYDQFYQMSVNKLEGRGVNFYTEVVRAINRNELPTDVTEEEFINIFKNDELFTSQYYKHKSLSLERMKKIFAVNKSFEKIELIVSPNNGTFEEFAKDKNKLLGCLSRQGLESIKLSIVDYQENGDELYFHYFYDQKENNFITDKIVDGKFELSIEPNFHSSITISVNSDEKSIKRPFFTIKMLLIDGDTLLLPSGEEYSIRWDNNSIYPIINIDNFDHENDKTLEFIEIDDSGSKKNVLVGIKYDETIDEDFSNDTKTIQYNVKYKDSFVTKIVIKNRTEGKTLDFKSIYHFLLHNENEDKIDLLNNLIFEEKEFLKYKFKNNHYTIVVDREFDSEISKYIEVNKLLQYIIDNTQSYYFTINDDCTVSEKTYFPPNDDEINRLIELRTDVLKAYEKIFSDSSKKNVDKFHEYHNSIKKYLNYYVNLVEHKNYIIKLDTIEFKDYRLFSPFSVVNLAFEYNVLEMFFDIYEKNASRMSKSELKDIKKIFEDEIDNSEIFKFISSDGQWYISKKPPIFSWLLCAPENKDALNNAIIKEKYLDKIVCNKLMQLKEIYPNLFNQKDKVIHIGIINSGNANFVVEGISAFLQKLEKVGKDGENEIKPRFHVSLIYKDNIEKFNAFDNVFDDNYYIRNQELFIKKVSYSKVNEDEIVNNSSLFFHLLFVKDLFMSNVGIRNMYGEESGYYNTYFCNGLKCSPLRKAFYSTNVISYANYNNYSMNLGNSSLMSRVLQSVNKYFVQCLSDNIQANNHPLRLTKVNLSNIPTQYYDKSFLITFLDNEIDLDIFNEDILQNNEIPFLIDYSNYNSEFNNLGVKYLTITNQREPFELLFKVALEDFLSNIDKACLDAVFKDINLLNGFWLLHLLTSKNNAAQILGMLGTLAAFRLLKSQLANDENYWHLIISTEEIMGVAPQYYRGLNRFANETQNKYCDDLAIISFPKNLSDLDNEIVNIQIKLVEVKNSSNVDYVKIGFEQLKQTNKLLKDVFDQKYGTIYQIRAKEIINWLVYNRNKYLLFDRNYLGLSLNIEGTTNIEDNFTEDLKVLVQLINNEQSRVIVADGILLNINNNDSSIEELSNHALKNQYFAIKHSEFKNLLENKTIEYENMKELLNYSGIEKQLDAGSPITEETREETSKEREEVMSRKPEIKDEDSVDIDKLNDNSKTTPSGTNIECIEDIKDKKQAKADVKVLLGVLDSVGNKLVYYDPKRPGKNLANMNVMITGSSGKGKTQLLKSMIMQLRKQGVQFLIFDFKNDFSNDPTFFEMGNFNYVNLERYGIPYNPLIPPLKEDHGDRYYNIGMHINAIVSVFGKSLNSFGTQQESNVKQAIKDVFTTRGIESEGIIDYKEDLVFPILNEIKDILKESDVKAYNRIEPFFSLNLFTEKYRNKSLKDLLSDSYVFNLSQIQNDEIKNAIARLIVESSHQYLNTLSHSQRLKNVFVFDEAHRILDAKNSEAITDLVLECRAYGLAMWLSSQYPSHYPPEVHGSLETKILHGNDTDTDKVKAIKKISGFDGEDKKIQDLGLFESIFYNSHYGTKFIKTMAYPHLLVVSHLVYNGDTEYPTDQIKGVNQERLEEMVNYLVEMDVVKIENGYLKLVNQQVKEFIEQQWS
ncbi:hypothetical protein HNQ80_001165 [Anaerosolibacter carboniphilus]|uniref:Type IV secretion system coupling protein TraD DNA-binding domain-containing protein n=1 Tax=Anaerosolibacter carboniphilus TaxID=1417629 RepID=A0A841KNR6_9FIRM|nr:type IV secretion system DNA-binding domain-containing protein [Anaerosolibacter carboniphilus]MBB6215076.1 hypothetical protein [Anaerosolibacter carboniphilus]